MYRSLLNTIAILSLLVLQGCSSSAWNTKDIGIQMKTVPSTKYQSLTSTVTEQPGGFFIFGFMKTPRYPAPKLKGHIDIDILDSEGQVLRTDTTKLNRFGRWKHAYIKYKYKADIQRIPPMGGVIQVSLHDTGIH